MSLPSNKVPCPCSYCGGKLVSRYIRRQHIAGYDSSAGEVCKLLGDSSFRSDCESHQHELAEGARHQEDTTEAPCSSLFVSDCDDNVQTEHSHLSLFVGDPADDLHTGDDCESGDSRLSYGGDSCSLSVMDEEYEQQPAKATAVNNQYGDDNLYEWPAAGQEEDPIVHAPLYRGASVTVLQTLAKYFDWFTSHPGTSKEALSSVLKMQHDILPEGHRLPDSYISARRLIEPFLVKPIVFDACSNDCILYRNAYASATECPKCKAPRYKREKIPARKFVYLPLGPRLVRMFGTKHLAQIVQAHPGASGQRTYTDMYDIHDSPTWTKAYSSDGIFEGDKRGLSFGFCADGVNPFSHLRVSYSMCPLVMTLLNLPRDSRYSFESLFLLGIIPGNGTKEAKKIDPYIEVLVDEIIQLSNVKMYDAYQQAPFKLKTDILLYILDYPGVGKMFRVTGSGAYKGCLWCDIKGTYSVDLRKMTYLQNRRYLPSTSSLRKRKRGFPSREKELQPPPAKKTFVELREYHKAVDNAIERKDAELITKNTGCKGVYSLMKLPHHDPIAQIAPDAMHTVKDVIVNIFDIITGRDDTVNCRTCEFNLGERFGITQEILKKKIQRKNPNVPYSLSSADVIVADRRATSVISPAHIGFVPGPFFSKCSSLKSHDWKQIASQGILKYCLRGLLGCEQRKALFQFIDVCCKVLAEKQNKSEIPDLLLEINTALAVLERDMPVTIQVITLHLMRHIVEGIEKFGPVYGTWMYSFERFNSWMCQRALNRTHPEVTIIETYRIYEWCCYVSHTSQTPTSDENVILTPLTNAIIELTSKDLEQLNDCYMKDIPEYTSLLTEYNKERERSISSRRKSLFPPKEKWKPPTRELTSYEQELLLGPAPTVTMLKRIQLCDIKTKRWITYSGAKSEQSMRVSSSYVSLKQSIDGTPQFGRIARIFSHTFAKKRTIFAEITLLCTPTFDNDVNMWSASASQLPSRTTFSILDHHISYPLVIACEDNYIWFLNYTK